MLIDRATKIAILGYGVEGRAALEHFLAHGYGNLTVCDANVALGEEMRDGVSVRLGSGYLTDLDDFDVVVRSPGIRYLQPEIQSAKALGVMVTSVTAYFLDQCPCPVIGVTGTKGKGTTATLIYEILRQAGRRAYLGGNIGEAPLKFLDELQANDLVVLEMSSFQLQDLTKSPRYAVLLNTTLDHLDYHVDRGEYLTAKENILAHQHEDCLAVLNADYEYVRHYEGQVKGREFLVSRNGAVKNGAFEQKGEIFYASQEGGLEKICEVGDIGLIGSHNVENVLNAVAVTRYLGVAVADIVAAVRAFKGLPHRLEFAGEVDGVRYFNDSFATTTETSIAAVDSFDEPTVLIAGGSDKGLDYREWALKVLEKPSLKAVVLIGDTALKMEAAIAEAREKPGEAQGSETKVLRRENLEQAFESAQELAETGGVVVMSPAAASFGLFTNYKERGERFRELVVEAVKQ